jgi:hypothetical protein
MASIWKSYPRFDFRAWSAANYFIEVFAGLSVLVLVNVHAVVCSHCLSLVFSFTGTFLPFC